MRRWNHDDRERRNSAETYNHPNVQDGARRAHDRARSADASDLFAHGAISSAAFASARCISKPANDCAEHVEALGLRPGRVGETLTSVILMGYRLLPCLEVRAVQAARLTRVAAKRSVPR